MTFQETIEFIKVIVSALGFGGTIAALLFAFRQYRRSEQWKKSEFVAKEIKEFESDPIVRNALLMIDWGSRQVNLFLRPDPSNDVLVEITRETQWKALLPHSLKPDCNADQASPASDAETEGEKNLKGQFTPVEARIRDTYDIFLDRLERFANFIISELVDANEFKPYLNYWIDSITANNNRQDDVAWQCTLLTYIHYYNYPGVKFLFGTFGKDIKPDGELYKRMKNSMADKELSRKLYESVRESSS